MSGPPHQNRRAIQWRNIMSSLSPRAFIYDDFIQNNGRIFQVARRDNANDRASFSFEDDFWMPLDLLKPHQRNFDGKFSFVEVPEWLKTDAKRYIAHLWLRTGAEANLLQQVLVSLRDLGRLLPDFHEKPIDLRARHAPELVRRYWELNPSPICNHTARRILNTFGSLRTQTKPDVKH